MPSELRPFEDPDHPGNKIRPEVKCRGCGKLGCVTAWGPWCFECNVPRMRRLDVAFEALGGASIEMWKSFAKEDGE